MKRSARAVLFLAILSLAAMAQSKSWRGTWSASAGSGGRAFGGTWDATLGEDPDTAFGSWSVLDQAGTTLASGTWSARKEQKIWRGAWKARTASNQVLSGTWRAQSPLPATAHLSGLLESAIAKPASGTWSMGAASGAWSIRASPPN